MIEGISVRFLTSSRKSCMKMASMASAAKKWRFFARASTRGLTSLRTWAVKTSRAASRSKAKASIHGRILNLFFCSTLLRCDLLAKKVPGRAPYSQHIIFRKWTYLNRSKTEHLKSFRPKTANKPINKLDRRRIWQKSVGSKSVQGEDRKERVANRELCR